jgi:DNA modification methylase
MGSTGADKIFCKSSEFMEEVANGSIALTVTSPPYWNAIDYDIHSVNPSSDYRTRSYSAAYRDYEEYLGWLERISNEVLRVTKPGGFYALVLGTVLYNQRHYPVPFDVASFLTRSGWMFHQDFIWHKVTGGVKRAGVFLQNPFPGYFYPNIMSEYILVFRKAGEPIYANKTQSEKKKASVYTGRLFTNEIANNVWHIAPVPPGHLEHPCPFPEEIPWRLIQMYSYPDEVVLDPFCGSGQTLKVARNLGRKFVGYDISPKYVEYAKSRIYEPLKLRKGQLISVFSSIPISQGRSTAKNNSRTRYGKKRPRAVD